MKSTFTNFSRCILMTVAALLLVGAAAMGQTTYTWIGASGGSWATSTNWSPTRTTPATNDIMVVSSSTVITALPTQTIGQLLIQGSGTYAALVSAGAVTLTIGGGTGTDFSIDGGATLVDSATASANAITISLSTGATGSVSGTFAMRSSGAGVIPAHKLLAVDASGVTFNSGAVCYAGGPVAASGITSNAFGTTNLNSIVFASGSTFIFINGSNPFGATAPSSVVVFQTGSLYKHQSSNTPSFGNRTYANFELNQSSTISGSGTTALVMDNLTVTLGTLNLNMTATPGHAIKGNISVASGATLTFSPASAGTFNFSGTSAQTITNSGTLTIGANQSFVVSNTSGVTFNSAVTMGGGTMTVNSGATLATAATYTTGAGATTINGNFQINQGGFASGSNFTYGGSSTLVFNNTSGSYGVNSGHVYWPTSSGPPNVTVQGAGGITLNDARTVSGLFQTAAGVVTNGNLTGNGTVQINSGGFFTGGPNYGSSSTLKINSGGSYGRGDEWSATSGAGYPANVQISNSTSYDLSNGGTGTARQCSGTLTIDVGSTFTMNNMTAGLTVLGDVANSGTLTLSSAVGGDIVVGGNWTRASTFNSNSRQVEFNGTSDQTITVSGGETFDYLRVNKSSGNLVLANDVTVNNTLTLTSGNISTGSNTFTLGSSGSVSRTSGHVIGNYKKAYSASANKTFEVGTANGYSPVDVDATGSGDFTVKAVQGAHGTPFSANSLQRYWSLTNGGITSANLTFYYIDPTDIVGTEANYAIRKYDGSWSSPGGSVDATNNKFSINGVTSFSDWTAAECATINLSPGSLPAGTIGVAYSQTISASGGTSPYTFAVTSGSLPPGLSLASGGGLTGTPTTGGTYNFDVTGTDANGCTGVLSYSITVSCPVITILPASLSAATVGTAYSETITGSGGTAPYTFAVISGSLPGSLSLASGGALTGTPGLPSGTFNFDVEATDANGCKDTISYSIVLSCPTITLSPPTLPDAQIGVAYSQTVTASGGVGSYTYALTSGSLPNGLSLSVGGAITGTTASPSGTFNFDVTATDDSGCTGTQSYSIVVSTCPTITLSPPTLPNAGGIGAAYSQFVSASGGTTPYSYTVSSGSLPGGLSLNSSTGEISGTVTPPVGTFNFDVTATDSIGCTGVHSYSITVCEPIALSALPNGTVGTAYSQAITPTGGTGPYTYAVTSGSVPAGLSLSVGGVLSGTPTTAGVSNFDVTVTDANGCSDVESYSITVSCPTITLGTLNDGDLGIAYADTIEVTGGTAPYSFAVTSGSLPPGLTLGAGTGILSGTPTLNGTYNFDVTVTDTYGCTGVLSYSINITCPTITLGSLPNGTVGTAYSNSVVAGGGVGPYTYAVISGSVPTGLSLSGAGLLSGTPTASGTFNFTVEATDANGCTGSQAYSVDMTCPTITPTPAFGSTLTGGSIGIPYSGSLSASGGTSPYSYSVTGGSLPPGVSLSGTGSFSGTPTTAGSYTFTVTITDAYLCSNAGSYTINVNCPTITLLPASVPTNVLTGSSYSQTITASGGVAPYTFAVTGGSLPPGLSLASGGALTGTPTTAGVYGFTVTATDVNGCTGSIVYSITVLNTVVTSVATGNWSTGATWDQGSKPQANQHAVIASGHTVTLTATDTCQSATVQTGGILSIGTTTLRLAGTYTLQAGAEGQQNAFNAVPGGGLTPWAFNAASTYTIGGTATGFSIGAAPGITFGHMNWNSTANGTPPVGTVIAGNLTLGGTGEMRCGTGATTSRTVTVLGNVVINSGTLVASNSTAPITGAIDITGDLTVNASGTLRGVNFTGAGSVLIGGSLVNNGGKIRVGDGAGDTGDFLVYFKGSGAGNINPGDSSAFRTVAIAPGRSMSLLDTMTINSTYTMTDSGSLDCGLNIVNGAGSFTLVDGATLGIGSPGGISASSATGNIQVTGTRTYSSLANYIYNGSSAQVTGDGLPANVNNLTFNNSSGISMNPTHTVNGTLALTSGVVSTGTFTLELAQPASLTRTAGHVNGNFKKWVTVLGGAGSQTWEIGDATNYTPVSLNGTTFTAHFDVTASTATGDHANIGTSNILASKSVNRSYSLNGTYQGPYNATFNFVSGDVDGGANTANFIVGKYNSPNWTYPTVGTKTSTSTQITGVTSFSDFQIGEAASFIITATAGSNGAITPSGSVVVGTGADQQFLLQPNVGYHVDSLFIDGVYNGDSTASYTFYGVSAVHTIHVTFAINGYTLTVVPPANGTITPGTTNVNFGGSQQFLISPAVGYHLDSVMVDGAKVDSTTSYTFNSVSANHTITALFSINTYTLNVAVVGSGSVGKVPNQPNYNHGTNVQLTATPSTGWVFDSWSGDASGNTNPLNVSMTSNKNITATFVEDSAYLVEYRSFSPESLAVDKDNKLKIGKIVKRKADKVDFKFVMVAPDDSISLKLKFSMVNSGVMTRGTTKVDTLASWTGVKELITTVNVDSGDTIQIDGRGVKGKQIKITYDWSTLPTHTKGTVLSYLYNIPRYPMPNRVNALFETFEQGGFGTVGLIVGKDRSLDSAKYYGWLQSAKYGDVLKSLYISKTATQHNGQPRGFNTFTNNGKPLVKRQKSLPPTKHDNKLLAEMIALKFNIAASQMEKIPNGFGELVYDDGGGNPLNGMEINAIASLTDSLMMGYYAFGLHEFADTATFDNLYATIDTINDAFEGPLDTVDFASKLHFKGVRALLDVPYLRLGSSMPAKITPLDVPLVEAPVAYRLDQNYPNPFNPTTTIRFDLPQTSIVTLKIYNTIGQEVATILDKEELEDGVQEVTFDAQSFATGVYFYRLTADGLANEDDEVASQTFISVKKMVLVK